MAAEKQADRLPGATIALAEAVRAACIQAALDGYEDARMAGLCWEGAWEAAIEAARHVDLQPVIRAAELVKDA
jgi:hypothetical protein